MSQPKTLEQRPVFRSASAAMLVGFVGVPAALVLILLRLGDQLPAATGAAAVPRTASGAPFDVALLALQVVVIVGVARLAGIVLKWVGQPSVIGEMVAGLALGPSVLGQVAPAWSATLFPPASLGFINVLAQVGLLLFMFLVGLDVDLADLRGRGKSAVITGHASIVVPFVLGTALALLLYSRFAPTGVGFTAFALFLGAAMSVTAFPVLARILADRGMTGTRLGAMAIACAAVNDITAWCILAGVVIVARAGAYSSFMLTIVGTVVYVGVMLTLGRRFLARISVFADRPDRSRSGPLAVVLAAALASAWITDRLGIHALFGAFLVGLLLPKESRIAEGLTSRLRDVMVFAFLPLFFAFTGLRTTVTLINGGVLWAVCGLILVVAIAGKIGGTAIAARATGMLWREALSLGALMNTRGLMELVILSVGLDIGVLSPTLFSMMVIMALVTTALTTPLLDWLEAPTSRAPTRQ